MSTPDKFVIGDRVWYIPGYKGYHAAEVVGREPHRYIIELSSGLQISCWEDELEEA